MTTGSDHPEGDERESDFDPSDPAMRDDPHGVYRRLRSACPVARSEQWGGFWMLTRFDDVVAVTREHETFLNSIQNVVPAVVTTGRRPPLHFDPPEHTLWRKAMSGPLKPQAITALEPKVRALTIEVLEPAIARGQVELVGEVAATLPVLSLCAFLNPPQPDAPLLLKRIGEAFLHAFQERDLTGLERESRRLYAVAVDILSARKQAPLDPERDMASALLAMRIDGRPPPEEYTQGALRQLLLAGHVAVTMMMGSCARHLAEHPALQDELRQKPDRIAAAVDELLRLYTPNQGFCRTATTPVTLHGQQIAAREPIVIAYPSANRDATRFDDPDAFQFDRPQKHLAFGNGIHKCPGEQLARLELRVFLEELLARTTEITLAGPATSAPWPEYGPRTLPLRLVGRTS